MATKRLDVIDKAFRALERPAQLRVLRNGASAALTPVVRALRSAAPKGTESHETNLGRTVAPTFLSRSIKKSARVTRDKTKVIAKVQTAAEAFYGSFLEFGWEHRAADPWFFPTVEAMEDEILEAYSDKVEQSIIREWNKS